MPRDFPPFPDAKIVFIDNPEDVHNLLSEIFGEDFLIGKNPSESKADFPIGKDDGDYPSTTDCSACPAKECPIRKAPYGATVQTDPTYEKFGKDWSETMKRPKDPNGRVRWPKDLSEVRLEPSSRPKIQFDLGNPFKGLQGKLESEIKALAAAGKKKKDAELDDLAARLFKKMSHQFYRDRAFRLSRIDELLGQVEKLTDELRNKEKVIGFYQAAVENHASIDWNKAADRKTGHLVYVTDDEFETLKALMAGTAKVVPARATVVVGREWVDFVDPMTGNLVVPLTGAKVDVESRHRGGTLLQRLVRVEASHPGAVRFTYRRGGVTLFFTSENGVVTPFDFENSKWHYRNSEEAKMLTPVPNDIPLNNMV